MSDVLSQEEIDALLSGASFDDEPIAAVKAAPRAPRREEVVHSIDVSKLIHTGGRRVVASLHKYQIAEETFFCEPGSTVLHDEAYARTLFNFDRVTRIVQAV